MTDLCANPVSEQERLTGRCAKDGQPLDAPRHEVQVTLPVPLSEQTPAEVDTQIAALWQEGYVQQARASQAWDSVKFYVTEVLRHQGVIKGRFGSKASVTQVREFLSEHSEMSESEEMQDEAYEKAWIKKDAQKAWEVYGKALDHEAAADDVFSEIQPLEEEWERRGRWNRAFLAVTNGTGHVHRSMRCSTCYVTTQYHWVTEYSDHTEAEIVAAAGERACTVCYPSAPVGVKGTSMYTPDEREKQERARQRAEAKAQRESSQINVTVYDGSKTPFLKTFKSERAVTNYVANLLGSLCWYGATHPSAYQWATDITACREKLVGTAYDYEKALAAARKKVTREGGQARY